MEDINFYHSIAFYPYHIPNYACLRHHLAYSAAHYYKKAREKGEKSAELMPNHVCHRYYLH